MKRRDLIRHILQNGCVFVREGGKHSVFLNPLLQRTSTVPRHSEINDYLAKKICTDLGILPP
ncbi:MAG: type II toxin-antitoxin system HicA family toxin [Candidatus Magasanikbacteria bacterium]|nr:type II toxin-antitoxin system HicA family toxin [Candidatus Magasanikbacteria bacterium]